MPSPWEVYEVSTIEITTGDSIVFQEGFYKVLDAKCILSGTVGAAPALTLSAGAVTICATANWKNLSTFAGLAAGNTAGMVLTPGILSRPIIARGTTLSLAATNVTAVVQLTIAKVKGYSV